MSKRALRKYLEELDGQALRQQLLDLYERFPEVKTYYDFVFDPREEELLREAMERIAEEYFPRRRKKARARRSVAQGYIRQFKTLGVDSGVLAELMAFNLETALRYERERNCPDAFYKSMLRSFVEWGAHLSYSGIFPEHSGRIGDFVSRVQAAAWPNRDAFSDFMEQLKP